MNFRGILRKTLGPYYYKRYAGIPDLFSFYKDYYKHNYWSRDQLLEYQIKKLRKLFIHAYTHTRYYRKLFDDYSFIPEKFKYLDQLDDLPILTKNVIREKLPDFLADNIGDDEKGTSFTGGTSGVKMQFFRDNICRSRRTAIQWRSDNWAGWDIHSNVAYIWPAIQDLMPDTGWKRRLITKYITKNYLFYAGLLNEQTAVKIAEELTRIKPSLIRCFPVPAVTFIECLSDNKIAIPGLKGVVTTGEPLYPHQRNMLEQGFDTKVFNLYASREVGTTAAECSAHGDLHIAIDSIALEITDKGKQLPAGQYGEILITDLENYAMPLIRYRIGDHGQTSDGKCSCGLEFPLLKNVVGRITDNLYDIHGNVIASPSLVLHLVDDGPPVGQVQIIQNSIDEILVRITKKPFPDDSVKDFYRENLKNIIKGLDNVRFEIVDKIDNEKSGKYRFSICNINPSEIARLRQGGQVT